MSPRSVQSIDALGDDFGMRRVAFMGLTAAGVCRRVLLVLALT